MASAKTQADTDQIRVRSAKYSRFATVLLVALTALFLLERFGTVLVRFSKDGATGESFAYLAFKAVTAVPEVCYLMALWWIRQALATLAAGGLFTPTLTRMLERVGLMLAVGGFITVFLVPGISRLLGFGPGYFIAYDVSALVLFAIGFMLKVLADVLRRAAALQAELDEMF